MHMYTFICVYPYKCSRTRCYHGIRGHVCAFERGSCTCILICAWVRCVNIFVQTLGHAMSHTMYVCVCVCVCVLNLFCRIQVRGRISHPPSVPGGTDREGGGDCNHWHFQRHCEYYLGRRVVRLERERERERKRYLLGDKSTHPRECMHP
jgi:hypothetical protein